MLEQADFALQKRYGANAPIVSDVACKALGAIEVNNDKSIDFELRRQANIYEASRYISVVGTVGLEARLGLRNPHGSNVVVTLERVQVWSEDGILRWTLRAGPAPTNGIRKATSGKVALFDAETPSAPFSLADWQAWGNNAPIISLANVVGVGNVLNIADGGAGAPNLHGALLASVDVRSVGMVQSHIRRIDNAGGARLVGAIGQATIIDDGFGTAVDIDGYGYRKSTDGLFTNNHETLSYANSGEVIEDASAGAFVNDGVWLLLNMRWNGTSEIEGWNSVDDARVFTNAIANQFASGRPGLNATGGLGATVTLMQARTFSYHKSHLVTATITPGWKLKLLDAADVVLGEATANVAGVASIDCLDIWLLDVVSVVVTDASDVEQARIIPTEGVFGGDDYEMGTAFAMARLPGNSREAVASVSVGGVIEKLGVVGSIDATHPRLLAGGSSPQSVVESITLPVHLPPGFEFLISNHITGEGIHAVISWRERRFSQKERST